MKTITNISPLTYKDMPLTDEKQEQLNTVSLIKTVLENSSYTSAGEIMKAVKLVDKIIPDEAGNINLDDADYDFVKKWVEAYQPLLGKGLIFSSFFAQFE